ncbi:MAG TPA: hypothetical protein VL588_05020 [Bdellovibrionota bacterium]|jgi:hypothetical protein|nr:hypothetical protein [Bdellovibrionota bacterium]
MTLLFSVLLALVSTVAHADDVLPFRSEVSLEPVPLTTERAWVADPHAPNPHRAAWLIERRVEFEGLESAPLKAGANGVKVRGLSASTRMHLRAPSARRYLTLEHFPCGAKRPDPRYMTRAGAEDAAKRAADLWNHRLEQSITLLENNLKHISNPKPEGALSEARFQLRHWLERLETKWRDQDLPGVERAVWEKMAADARNVCSAGRAPQALPRWEDLMDPPPLPGKVRPLVLARAPARRWGGVFSVRATVDIGGTRLNGHFLIDPESTFSMISPSFMEEQAGGLAQLLGLAGEPQTFGWHGEKRAGRRIYVDAVEVSGYPLAVDELVLSETRVFLPPEHVSSCCDGVLGRDFLARYSVEFDPLAVGSHVKIWDRQGFVPPPEWVWVEAGRISGDGWASDCGPTDVRWATAESYAVRAIKEDATGGLKKEPGLTCGSVKLARDLQVPAATVGVGMDLLGRGPFALDFPNGRVWFEPKALDRGPLLGALPGLVLEFQYEKGERHLRVSDLKPEGPVPRTLQQAGLKPRMEILTINGTSAGDMDLWEVERALRGDRGKVVTLKWRAGKEDKTFPLTVED